MGARHHARRQMVGDGRGTQEGRRQMQTYIVEKLGPTGGGVWGALAIGAATAAHFALQYSTTGLLASLEYEARMGIGNPIGQCNLPGFCGALRRQQKDVSSQPDLTDDCF